MDWNNDGKKDLITGERDGHIRIYLNKGTDANPVFSGFTYLKVANTNFTCGLSSIPEVVDWNNDGKKDVLCGEDGGQILLLQNVGTDANPVFTQATFLQDGVNNLSVERLASPVAVDWDGDGKKDLIVGSSMGQVHFYRNLGTDARPSFNGRSSLSAGGTPIALNQNAQPAVVDWDNDGRLDLICGAYAPRYDEVRRDAPVWYFHAASGPYLTSYTTPGATFEPGSRFKVVCTLRNPAQPASLVGASLSTTSPWCTVTSGAWPVGELASGAQVSNAESPFEVAIAADAPLGISLPLLLGVSAGSSYYNINQLRPEVTKPAFSIADFLVNDSQGDRDCALDQRERGQLIVRLKNNGYPAANVRAWLVGGSPGFTFPCPSSSFGAIGRGETAVNSALPFAIDASVFATNAYSYLTVYATCERAFFTNVCYIDFLPDYPYTTNVAYSWIDTTGGTTVSLTYSDYEYISLPFAFSFYDYRYLTTVFLTSFGYLEVLGASLNGSNTEIPATSQPNGIIAPFWDDLDPSAGGLIRHKTFGTPPNRYWVAEFNGVRHRRDPSTRATFEVIVYESGNIKFQYGVSAGTYGDGSSATIGLENLRGAKGCQYAFNQPGAVTNGLAILFKFEGGSMDADHDGMPDSYETFYFKSLQAAPGDDADGDGLSNLAEFGLGTDPTSATSQLRLQEIAFPQSEQYCLRWQAIPGRGYSVWQAADLAGQGWVRKNTMPIWGDTTGAAAFTGALDPGPGPFFWRVSTP